MDLPFKQHGHFSGAQPSKAFLRGRHPLLSQYLHAGLPGAPVAADPGSCPILTRGDRSITHSLAGSLDLHSWQLQISSDWIESLQPAQNCSILAVERPFHCHLKAIALWRGQLHALLCFFVSVRKLSGMLRTCKHTCPAPAGSWLSAQACRHGYVHTCMHAFGSLA